MARVYVSSTVADLEAERQAVVEWLVAAQHQVVHSYRPNSDTVRDSCLADVDTCDLYVLILGHRYGFQPPEDNPEGLSITQLEFRQAGQSRKPRIALLRTSIPDVSRSDMADPQRLALVLAFRAEVAREVRPAEFADLRGLVQELSTGVQAEQEKVQAELAKQPAAPVTAGRVVRLAPRGPATSMLPSWTHLRADPRPRASGHLGRPRSPGSGPGRLGMRPGPGTSTPRCCPSMSGRLAPSTRKP